MNGGMAAARDSAFIGVRRIAVFLLEYPLITKTEKTEGRTASNSEALWRLGMPFQQHPSDARLSHPKRRSKQRRRKYKTPCKSTIYVEVSVHKILSALALLIVVLASVF